MAATTVRNLSHDTAGVLARVERGEIVEITKSGRPIARIVPIAPDPLAELRSQGVVRPAQSEEPLWHTGDDSGPLPDGSRSLPDEPLQGALRDIRSDRL